MAIQLQKSAGFLSGYPSSGLPAARSNHTLMCWINNTDGTLWGSGGTASICGMYSGTYNASTTPVTATQIGTRTGTTFDVWTWGGTVMISSIAPVAPPVVNKWYHIAYVYNVSTTTHQLYINGVLNNTTVNTIQQAGTFTQVYINGYPQASPALSETNNALVDGVRCFNRALTANEILTIYNSQGFRDGIAFGQVANYMLNGPVGIQLLTVSDLSGLNSLLTNYASTTNIMTYTTGPVNSLTRPPL